MQAAKLTAELSRAESGRHTAEGQLAAALERLDSHGAAKIKPDLLADGQSTLRHGLEALLVISASLSSVIRQVA